MVAIGEPNYLFKVEFDNADTTFFGEDVGGLLKDFEDHFDGINLHDD